MRLDLCGFEDSCRTFYATRTPGISKARLNGTFAYSSCAQCRLLAAARHSTVYYGLLIGVRLAAARHSTAYYRPLIGVRLAATRHSTAYSSSLGMLGDRHVGPHLSATPYIRTFHGC